MNILDYCNDFASGKIKVDTNYQRTDKVWPEQAKKYLIESILLGYPIPKFFLHQKIDTKSKTAIKFVVDGQQRSKAILEFFQNGLAISRKCENSSIAGKVFDSLPEEYQNNFLSYSISIDLFVTANKEEIIETFRRINSYTVPLNAEEKRHAYHQGEMKWFIHEQASKYSDKLQDLGVFTEKNLARMADYKFYAEIVIFLIKNEIITTAAKTIDDLYVKNDKVFIEAVIVEAKFNFAFSIISDWDWLKDMAISTTHVFQLLVYVLASNEDKEMLPIQKIMENISILSEVLETKKSIDYKDFAEAVSRTTNDGTRRKKIAGYLIQAIYV